jgi:sec-independent protein translocase protein TatA
MGGLGAPELIIILLVVLLLFGSTKLPKLAKSLGEAQKEFKKGVADSDTPVPTTQPVVEEERVTMTKAQLDALLADREAQVRRAELGKDAPPAV